MNFYLSSSNPSATDELSENEAIRLAQEGNSEGFERLYRLHSRRVYSLCLHMSKDPLEAEDFTQDAFLQAFRKIQSFRGDSLFSTWLHRLTVNIVLMGFRQRKRPKVSLDEALELNEESRKPTVEFSQPDLTLNGVIDRINLVKAINQLPRGCKKMLLLHDIQGYKHDEISRMVGCSVENSKSQLHRARRRLRRLLPNHSQRRANSRLFRRNLEGGSSVLVDRTATTQYGSQRKHGMP
jgi:RNA polymerase sigma-70 factor, ECF subfamily